VNGLKAFFDQRSAFILAYPEFQNEAPVISEVKQKQEGAHSTANEDVTVTVQAAHPDGLQALNLFYSPGLAGEFLKLTMNDNGQDGDEIAMDGIYSVTIPGQGAGSFVRYYIQAAAADDVHTQCFMPAMAAYDVFIYKVRPLESDYAQTIVINELMASNSSVMYDEAEEADDWVELYNTSSESVSLEGFHLSDNASNLNKWMLPDTLIAPESYLVIWTDDDEEQGTMHASFKLASAGEELILMDSDSAIVDRIIFPEQDSDVSFDRMPNGTGDFVQMPASFLAENTLTWTDVAESSEARKFKIYPNPADEVLFIRANDSFRKDINIFSISGSLIKKQAYSEQIDISWLEPGLYIIKCGLMSVKVVVN